MLNLSKILAVTLVVAGQCGLSRESEASDQLDFAQIERGRYLTVAGDCAACHTLPGAGKPFAGGRPIETPFGTLLGPNITPDRETGIGAWTDREFISAMKSGIGRHGVRLFPVMPYAYYTKMTDEDVLAIRAYLNTVAPVRNEVIPNQLPFPFNIRASLRVWNALYFQGGEFKPVEGKSAEWNRGAYLVEGPMHCGECHTPKSMLGGDKEDKKFQGFALQGWYAPDITNDGRRGLGSWSPEEIVDYLKTGHNKVAAASGPMAEEVELSSSKMSDEDLKAVAVYLKDLPAGTGRTDVAVAASDPMMQAGMAIFNDSCAACHNADGKGSPGLFPALSGAPSIQSADPMSLIRVVINGAKSAATDAAPTAAGMPSYARQLSDEQVAAVVTYIRNSWGNAASAVTAGDVTSARAELTARND